MAFGYSREELRKLASPPPPVPPPVELPPSDRESAASDVMAAGPVTNRLSRDVDLYGGAMYEQHPSGLPKVVKPSVISWPSRASHVPPVPEDAMPGGFTMAQSKLDPNGSAVVSDAIVRGGIDGESMVIGIFSTPREQKF